MFLLIPNTCLVSSVAWFYFKFHYVSINSEFICEGHQYLASFKFHYVSINSELGQLQVKLVANFKFHYVSINSGMDIDAGTAYMAL